MNEPLIYEKTIRFETTTKGARKRVREGQGSKLRDAEPGHVPRVSRLMALAIRFQNLLRAGVVDSYTELAELGRVSKPRISQIMNLLALAPDIQEEILFFPKTVQGRAPVILAQVQPIAAEFVWERQRSLWEELLETPR